MGRIACRTAPEQRTRARRAELDTSSRAAKTVASLSRVLPLDRFLMHVQKFPESAPLTATACGSGTNPMSFRASGTPSDMARLWRRRCRTREVMALIVGASLEMSPRERDAIAPAAEFLAPGTEVFISSPPAVSHHDIVSAAVALRRHGFEPVPHVAARSSGGLHPVQRPTGPGRRRGGRPARTGDRRRSRATRRTVSCQSRSAGTGPVREVRLFQA